MTLTTLALSLSVCSADLNFDFNVDGRDLQILLINYGDTFPATPLTPLSDLIAAGHPLEEAMEIQRIEAIMEYSFSFRFGDINADATIDGADLSLLLANWGCAL